MVGESSVQHEGYRHLALCYVRLSYARDEAALNSVDRQRANVLALCEQHGWTPVWFEEPQGHRSAYREDNHPEWQRLKEWVGNPQVVAVVANDPSRLYRKMWRMGSFLDTLDDCQVRLLFASPGSPIRDIRNPMDRFILQMYAMMDESYVHDMAQRQKDSIAFRHRQGKTTGIPPFGVVRNAEGYLLPSPWGAWVYADGRAVTGRMDQEPADGGAEWRGYYDCAYHILKVYAEGHLGRAKLARRLDDEGWRFRDRRGEPRRLDEDDIRRVVSNWTEYGGSVGPHRAKDRGTETVHATPLPFVAEHAVFPLELLREVVTVIQTRYTHPIHGSRAPRSAPRPLAGLCYCAHCEPQTKLSGTPRHRARLGTCLSPKTPIYRHRSTIDCDTIVHSLPAETLERDVGRLIDLLMPDETTWQTLLQAAEKAASSDETVRQRQQAAQMLADCAERHSRAKQLYLALEIDETEYRACQAQYRQDLAQLRAVSTVSSAPLAFCRAKLVLLQSACQSGSLAEQRSLAHEVFEDIGIDLDSGRITAFRLKPWLEDYLRIVAASLTGNGQLETRVASLSDCNLDQRVLARLYPPNTTPAPVPARVEQQVRNATLRRRYAAGETLSDLALFFGISPQRVHQIVHERRK